MATYEVLEPGGHARLVSDIKAYVNRADGVGTTQLADESVTMDKLGEDVTNELDGIMHDGDQLNGNILIGELAESALLTADDAYAAPPKGVSVYGKSVQDGTPTPDAPVAIQSVDDLTLNVCGFNVWDEQWERGYIYDTTGENAGTSDRYVRSKNYIPVVSGVPYNYTCTSDSLAGKAYYYDGDKTYLSFENVTFGAGADKTPPANAHYMRFWLNHPETYSNDICINVSDTSHNGTYAPYTGTVTTVPLDSHELRSLPDGTEDSLTLSYIGPSTENGSLGVYSAELTQRVSYVADVTTLRVNGFDGSGARPYITFSISIDSNRGINSTTINTMATAHQGRILSNQSPCIYTTGNGGTLLIGDSRFSGLSQSDAVELLQGESVQWAIATPVTHDLGTIELPVLPFPDVTAWADGGSAQPTLSMEYEQDINIVIEQLEAQIEDLVTS